MRYRPLAVPDVVVFEPEVHGDRRGSFAEWMRADALRDATGRGLQLAQANISVSARGVLRGVHFAAVPHGQAKFASAVSGRLMDFAVDLRVGSPTFGLVDSVLLDAEAHTSIFLPEGIGHAFVAVSESATLCYLVDQPFTPEREFTVSPLDPRIGLDLPFSPSELVLSDRDAAAPSLGEAEERGLLPSWDECRAAYEADR